VQRIGLIGCGRVTTGRYVEVCRDELTDALVVVACDTAREKADYVAQSLSCDAVYEMDAVLNRNDVDVVIILTESGNHYEHTKRALLAGKHVIVEKPPAMLPPEVRECQELAEQSALMYAPVVQNRFNPAMVALKSAQEHGRFGTHILSTIRLRWCRYQDYYEDGWHGTWMMDGGVINQQAFHHVDALQWVCGPIDAVVSAQANALNELEAEDTTVAVVRFKDGSLGVIEATTAARPEDFEASISLVGEKGMAVIGGIALNNIETWSFIEPLDDDSMIPSNCSQEVPTGYGLSHGPLIQSIIDRLEQGSIDPPISGSDVVPTLKLVHALYRSAEVGGWAQMDDNPVSDRLGV